MRKSSTPPVLFDILGILLRLFLLITRPYYFCLLLPMIPFRQRHKNWCEQIIDKCCTTEKWTGELKFWRLVWCEEVDKDLTSQLNRGDTHFLKSLDIETQYKTCISRVKIVSLQNCRWSANWNMCHCKIPTGHQQKQPFADVLHNRRS